MYECFQLDRWLYLDTLGIFLIFPIWLDVYLFLTLPKKNFVFQENISKLTDEELLHDYTGQVKQNISVNYTTLYSVAVRTLS